MTSDITIYCAGSLRMALNEAVGDRAELVQIKLRSAGLPIPAASYGVLRKFCHSPADCGNALSLRARFLTACSPL
jgi:hypothetical protein